MTVELVASLAPAPSVNTRVESQRSGMAPVLSFELEFCYSGSGKGKLWQKLWQRK
jgi:hypothetical protein